MARSWSTLIAAAALMLGTSALCGQELINGRTRVRITVSGVGSRDRHIAGTLARADMGTWVVRLNERGDSAVVPLSDISEVRVSRGARRNVLQGMAIGALIGSVLGVATHQKSGGVSCHPQSVCGNWGYPLQGLDSPALAAGVLGLGGALYGAAIGALVKTERWRSVNQKDVHLAIWPSSVALRAGASLRF